MNSGKNYTAGVVTWSKRSRAVDVRGKLFGEMMAGRMLKLWLLQAVLSMLWSVALGSLHFGLSSGAIPGSDSQFPLGMNDVQKTNSFQMPADGDLGSLLLSVMSQATEAANSNSNAVSGLKPPSVTSKPATLSFGPFKPAAPAPLPLWDALLPKSLAAMQEKDPGMQGWPSAMDVATMAKPAQLQEQQPLGVVWESGQVQNNAAKFKAGPMPKRETTTPASEQPAIAAMAATAEAQQPVSEVQASPSETQQQAAMTTAVAVLQPASDAAASSGSKQQQVPATKPSVKSAAPAGQAKGVSKAPTPVTAPRSTPGQSSSASSAKGSSASAPVQQAAEQPAAPAAQEPAAAVLATGQASEPSSSIAYSARASSDAASSTTTSSEAAAAATADAATNDVSTTTTSSSSSSIESDVQLELSPEQLQSVTEEDVALIPTSALPDNEYIPSSIVQADIDKMARASANLLSARHAARAAEAQAAAAAAAAASPAAQPKLGWPIIAGIAGGGFVGLLLIGTVVMSLRKRKRERESNQGSEQQQEEKEEEWDSNGSGNGSYDGSSDGSSEADIETALQPSNSSCYSPTKRYNVPRGEFGRVDGIAGQFSGPVGSRDGSWFYDSSRSTAVSPNRVRNASKLHKGL